MKTFLQNAFFKNRAPFEDLILTFTENQIAVLSGVNGRGKTTIVSHIVDAMYEMARPNFRNEFEGKENKFYRMSSALYAMDSNRPSIVYFRFKVGLLAVDYLDVIGDCTEADYDAAIQLHDKIRFQDIVQLLSERGSVKKLSTNFTGEVAKLIFSRNLLTYFPSYRHELPAYLNSPYKTHLKFRVEPDLMDFLTNPIEVVTTLPKFANWLLDVALDYQLKRDINHETLFQNLNHVLNLILSSKRQGNVRFGIGLRYQGGSRIQVIHTNQNQTLYPSIFLLSAGELSALCIFGELIRQADNYSQNIILEQVTGIVLIDEIDKHLHIRIQKEILPALLNLFPNVQFILASHSPFLSMGLATLANQRTSIFDLDNFGISTDAFSNPLYLEVYEMMVSENQRFKAQLDALQQAVQQGTVPLVITEGKTDSTHLMKARSVLNPQNLNIDFFEIPDDWGDSKLSALLEQLSKVPQTRRIIGIFDRDVPRYVQSIEQNGSPFKNYGNNVFAFCIPIPHERENFTNISIEFYYTDEHLRREKNGRRLAFTNEVEVLHNKTTNRPEIRVVPAIDPATEGTKKILDEPRMCDVTDWVHSKSTFAQLISTDDDFAQGLPSQALIPFLIDLG